MVEYLRFVPVIKNIVSWLQTHPLGLVTLGFGHCKPHERICQKRMLEREPARLEEEGLAPSHLLPIPVPDPIDGLLPGSSVPGILQARMLEWVAISFSNAGK